MSNTDSRSGSPLDSRSLSQAPPLSLETVVRIRDSCLCLHAQRAARALARRFDAALKPAGLNNGQFSLMVALSRPAPWNLGELAELLAMDRTTLTAKLKRLERRGLVETRVDEADRRGRKLTLTDAGRTLIAGAVPLWEAAHAQAERKVPGGAHERLRAGLVALSG